MKTLNVPFVADLEKMNFQELEIALETGGTKDIIGEIGWPDRFSYKPSCVFSIAHSDQAIAILYHVRGLDLRAAALEDNGSVWEDSCCEFFVADPSGEKYYNFEMNCIGTVLNASGAGRENRLRRSPEEMKKIIRFSSLEHKQLEEADRIFEWQTAIIIPFEMIGADPENLPETLRANFYKCGDKTAHPHFLSWNPILTEKPDFHRPDFFGEIKLMK